MRVAVMLAVPLMFIGIDPLAGQPIPEAEAHRAIADILASHVEANVPEDAAFARLLQRDLDAFFAGRGFGGAAVSFDLLRAGATQSGVAYPKYYLWVRVRASDGRSTSGAVRVAAIDRRRFDVTDFLSASEIKADPGIVRSVFPAALVPGIVERAAG